MNCREEQISEILARYRIPSHSSSYALGRNTGFEDFQVKGEYVFDKYEQTWHSSSTQTPEISWLKKLQSKFNKS